MAINAQTAKSLIQQRNVPPPTGIAPGSPEYDQWATNWLQAAVDAGDPAAIEASGGRRTEGGRGVIASGQPAAPLAAGGTPTPSQLRAKAKAEGWSEDFERFDDRQLAAWISKSWDANSGRFKNDAGDIVEKPTESGPLSSARGWATGEQSAGRGGGRGFGGGGGQAAQVASGAPAVSGRDALQQGLIDQYQGREGMFVGTPQGGEELSGGGIFWGQQSAAAPKPPAVAAMQSGSGATPLSQGVTPAQPAAAVASAPAPAPAPASNLSTFAGKVSQAMGTTTDRAIPSMEKVSSANTALQDSLRRQYPSPDRWWQKGAAL